MAVSVQKYNTMGLKLGNGNVDLRTGQVSATGMFVALMATAHAFAASNSVWADVCANQIAAGGGYTQFNDPLGTPVGKLLTSVTWAVAGSVATYDAGDTVWTAAGDTIPISSNGASAAVLVNVGTSAVADLLLHIGFGQFETAGDGTDFKITWNASGIFTVT